MIARVADCPCEEAHAPRRHGFTEVGARILAAAPGAGTVGTLMGRATGAEGRARHRPPEAG
ncbi:hypothetical protein GLX30_11305 [Streptomyces sp. Tu 2975]|uniref:hypothetical protein n=1 Tax=Streptomyces sp. Tu 2975 TaxID=2676871 RepID=UPI00135C86DF|nr:hypothetical protein [Streptomyces sp. Tu 2975]QIP84512.1 hypothetical protein GLX30_11305 [Streptomyces sp. Tu 2975]